MPLVVAIWPNNTISIVKMRAKYEIEDLYCYLDAEDDPICAKCYEVRPREGEGPLHVAFNWKEFEATNDIHGAAVEMTLPFENLRIQSGDGGSARIKRIRWPEDIVERHFRRLRPSRSLVDGEVAE